MATETSPPKRVQDARIEIRCRSEDKAALEAAAEADGRGLSAWLLRVGLREARKTRRT